MLPYIKYNFFAFGIMLNKDEMSAGEWQTRRALISHIYIFYRMVRCCRICLLLLVVSLKTNVELIVEAFQYCSFYWFRMLSQFEIKIIGCMFNSLGIEFN